MTKARLIQIVALLACAGLIFGASRFVPSINEGRRALNMIGADVGQGSAPPEFAFAVQAFGAFRGLLTNIAFIRATEYKEQGRYYDAMQLANWICKLQPRFPSVWEFNAWNMAWNISVTTYTPEERWNWVYNGARLLRDEGLRYNPRAINLYKQLAWIFVNKMSESVDDFHNDYKRNWAWRMHLLFGPPPDPLGDVKPTADFQKLQTDLRTGALYEAAEFEELRRGGHRHRPKPSPGPTDADTITPYDVVKRAAYERIQAIEDAASSLGELYEKFPETRAMVARLRDELGAVIRDERLEENEYWHESGLAMQFFLRLRKLSDPTTMLVRVVKKAETDPDAAALERFDQIVGVREKRPAGEALVRFLQRKVAREVYKLDTAHLAELMKLFGPMDWRVVDAHSLYWVTRAIIEGQETINDFRNDKTNTARILFFSLRNLYLRNRLIFEPYPPDISRSYINPTPDINFIEPMHQAYIVYGPMLDPDSNDQGAGETYRTGHVNFLRESIRMLWLSDRIGEAQKYYDYLRATYGTLPHDGSPNPEYLKPLNDFVMDAFYESIDTLRDTQVAINALLLSAYNELAQGNLTRYNNLVNVAYDLHERYSKEKADPLTDRLQLAPFVEMQADAMKVYLVGFPAVAEAQTLHKARLWGVAPVHLKQRVFDELADYLKEECDLWQFDFAKAFPEPPGMAEFRAEAEKLRLKEADESGVVTPAQPR